MGCGQSHIAIIYPRKSKNKEGSKRNESDEEVEGEQSSETGGSIGGGCGGATSAVGGGIGGSNEVEEAKLRAAARVRQMVQMTTASGPLLAQASVQSFTDISSSQSDFFKMLDEKIESGADYDSSCEYEIALEHARLCRLLHDWETAKQRSARSRSAPTTPAKRYNFQTVNGDAVTQRMAYPMRPWYQPIQPQYQFSNSVVMYDKSRGGYYTELA